MRCSGVLLLLLLPVIFCGDEVVQGEDDGPVPFVPNALYPSDEALIVTDYDYCDLEVKSTRVHVSDKLIGSSFLEVPPLQLFVEGTKNGKMYTQTCHGARWESKSKGTRYLTAAHCLCHLSNITTQEYTNFAISSITIRQIINTPEDIYCKVPNAFALRSLSWCTEPQSPEKLKNDFVLLDCGFDLSQPNILPGKAMATALFKPREPVVLTAVHWKMPEPEERKRMGETGSTKNLLAAFGEPQNNNYQWGMLDNTHKRNDRLKYSINTLKGFSGTGLYQEFDGGEWKLVGMHQGDDLPNLKNAGISLAVVNERERHVSDDEL